MMKIIFADTLLHLLRHYNITQENKDYGTSPNCVRRSLSDDTYQARTIKKNCHASDWRDHQNLYYDYIIFKLIIFDYANLIKAYEKYINRKTAPPENKRRDSLDEQLWPTIDRS